MIAQFPTAYPDELVYSILARYYMKSGYINFVRAAEELFLRKTTAPSVEFMNEYRDEIKRLLAGDGTMEDVALQHTMFPEFGRFIGAERRRKALAGVAAGDPQSTYLVAMPTNKTGKPRHIWYCPECAREDRERYGETYWHRVPQIIGLDLCPVHGCRLIETDIEISGRSSPDLIAAEEIIPVDTQSEKDTDGRILELARYMADVFQSPVPMDKDTPVGIYLDSRLQGTKYKSLRGLMRKMSVLRDDFDRFCSGIGIQAPERWKVDKIFCGSNFSFSEICLLAFFLAISPQDLVEMQMQKTPTRYLYDRKIRTMHQKGMNYRVIADAIGGSYDYVKMIGEHGHAPVTRKKKNRRGGAKEYDWNKLDQESLPKVQAAIAEMEAADGINRPRRITVTGVAKQAGISNQQIRNSLPLCRAEIQGHMVSTAEFWAKETIWALHQVQLRGETPNWKHLRIITNISRADMDQCIPYLSKYATAKEMALLVRQGVIPDRIQEE